MITIQIQHVGQFYCVTRNGRPSAVKMPATPIGELVSRCPSCQGYLERVTDNETRESHLWCSACEKRPNFQSDGGKA
jgi:hypothetical protein